MSFIVRREHENPFPDLVATGSAMQGLHAFRNAHSLPMMDMGPAEASRAPGFTEMGGEYFLVIPVGVFGGEVQSLSAG